jgi:hypothetical protein
MLRSRDKDLARRAVQLEHVRAAGRLMQPVDILRDHAAQPPAIPPAGERGVAGAGLGLGEVAVGFALLPPILVAGRGAGEKILKINGLVFRPHAARRAEIGNAALRADAGAGEGNGGSRVAQPSSNFGDSSVHGTLNFQFAIFNSQFSINISMDGHNKPPFNRRH